MRDSPFTLMNDYKVVLVLGNGFDLDLGLPTGYSDFLQSPFFYEFLNSANILKYHRFDIQKDNILEYLQQQKNLKNWIDIEVELKNLAIKTREDLNDYGQVIKFKNKATYEIEKSFEVLRKQLCWYLDKMEYTNIKKDSYAIRLLDIIKQNHAMCEILTYNYTDIHKLKSIVGDIYVPIDHVHGNINDKSIIIGFQDKVEIDKSFSFMIKSFSPFFRSHNVRNKLMEADEIIFFGHSLGETDYHYFGDFFETQSNPEKNKKSKKIRIFTWDEASRIDILFQLREMNDRRTDMLYDLNDMEIYRTKDDKSKIDNYLSQLSTRLLQKTIVGPSF